MQMSQSKSGWTRKAIVLSVALVLVLSAVAYVKSGSSQAPVEEMDRNVFVVTSYACPAGTYQSGVTSSGCVCTKCPAGSKCPGGTNAPKIACSIGTYQPLKGQATCKSSDPGWHVPGTGATQQKPCLAGSYQPNPKQGSCIPAEKGKKVPGDKATSSVDCSPGSYQPARGQKSCLTTSVGTHAPNPGAVNPTNCRPGSYQDKTGQASCKPASKGHEVPSEGASYQTKCPPGQYQNNVGKSSCIPAKPGHHVPNSGGHGETICGANTYQPCGGQHQCIPCPAEKGSNPGSTSCPFSRVCVVPNGTPATTFGKLRAGKSGKLKSIKVMYLSGLFKYCGAGSGAGCQGYYGIADGNHQFDLFFTRRDYTRVLFPLKGNTVGMTPSNAAKYPAKFPFYKMAGKLAQSKQDVTYLNNAPATVTAGEELRVYAGEVLYQYYQKDNVGQVCYNLQLTIQ